MSDDSTLTSTDIDWLNSPSDEVHVTISALGGSPQSFDVPFGQPTTVEQMLKAAGVPASGSMTITMNGKEVDLRTRIEGDAERMCSISVLPSRITNG
jgi:hypothetical protein